ncbi:DUF1353 domain-containing protein [Pleionea sediminis]|uniref:DUF1353 domain-containing protein n=1 Tax=Pleionea sediminis TaxID=2569479 RepID=UPI001185CEED|nr:DUF1353 domain-containing protein [Pleionea sediminis]
MDQIFALIKSGIDRYIDALSFLIPISDIIFISVGILWLTASGIILFKLMPRGVQLPDPRDSESYLLCKPGRIDWIVAITLLTSALLIVIWLFLNVVISPYVLLIVISVLFFHLIFFGWHFKVTENIERNYSNSTKCLDSTGKELRDKGGFWVNALNESLSVRLPLRMPKKALEIDNFYGEWLILEKGEAIVNPGKLLVKNPESMQEYDFSQTRSYAWNGCSPKFRFMWFLVGTPDLWPIVTAFQSQRNEAKKVIRQKRWQAALRASLVHDAFYQYLNYFKEHSEINKLYIDRLFYTHLLEDGVPSWLATIYYLAVRVGGGRD